MEGLALWPKFLSLSEGKLSAQAAAGSGPEMSLQAYWQSLLTSTSLLFSVFPIPALEENEKLS